MLTPAAQGAEGYRTWAELVKDLRGQAVEARERSRVDQETIRDLRARVQSLEGRLASPVTTKGINHG